MRFNKILSGEFCLEEEPRLVLCGELLLVTVLPSLFEENGKLTPTISLFTHQVSNLVGLPQAKIQPVSAGLLGLSVLFCFVLYKACRIQSSNSSAITFGSRISPYLTRSLYFWGKFCGKKGQYYFTLFYRKSGLQEDLRSEPGTKFFSCILQCSPSEVTVSR